MYIMKLHIIRDHTFSKKKKYQQLTIVKVLLQAMQK